MAYGQPGLTLARSLALNPLPNLNLHLTPSLVRAAVQCQVLLVKFGHQNAHTLLLSVAGAHPVVVQSTSVWICPLADALRYE